MILYEAAEKIDLAYVSLNHTIAFIKKKKELGKLMFIEGKIRSPSCLSHSYRLAERGREEE